MVNSPFFREVLGGMAGELSAVMKAESLKILLTLSLRVTQPFLELGDNLIRGL